MSFDELTEELAHIEARGLLRRLRPIDGSADAQVDIEGRRLLMLASNNYLGLATHPALCAAAADAARRFGAGSGASRLVSGDLALHHDLETRLARFKHAEAALLFTSGYQANIGAIPALVGSGDAVFSDALNHASIVDGCRLSRARTVVFAHRDTAALERLLQETPARRRLIVTDSVFSMDGDLAPLVEIVALARRFDAWVMLDEAHATGVFGPTGAGAAEELGLVEQVSSMGQDTLCGQVQITGQGIQSILIGAQQSQGGALRGKGLRSNAPKPACGAGNHNDTIFHLAGMRHARCHCSDLLFGHAMHDGAVGLLDQVRLAGEVDKVT